jgi:ubiquinone/menaquinone biosynthesis C-methylase UbiE
MLKRATIVPILVIAIGIAAAGVALAQVAEPSAHHSFSNIEHWAKVFESPERDAWQKPDKVVKALDLKPGETVVDIGAGTGYFTRRFAAAVAPTGRAIGLDVEPAMVEYMRKDARTHKLSNYEPRLVKPDDAELAPASVDVIFLCDAYHHIDNRVGYFHRLIPALKPGGRVVIVDFFKRPLPVGPPPPHKISLTQVKEEMGKAGYKLTRTYGFLPYQYFVQFEPRELSHRSGH